MIVQSGLQSSCSSGSAYSRMLKSLPSPRRSSSSTPKSAKSSSADSLPPLGVSGAAAAVAAAAAADIGAAVATGGGAAAAATVGAEGGCGDAGGDVLTLRSQSLINACRINQLIESID